MARKQETGDLSDVMEMLQGSSPRSGGVAIDPHYIWDVVLRFRWLIIISFCLAMLVGIYLALNLPRVYQSDTLILVENQRVPDDFVHAIVTADIDARISTIQQQIMSRTNLIGLIEKFDLFTGPDARDLFMDEKVDLMRDRINVELLESNEKQAANAFRITYRGENPDLVYRITNELTTYVIDQNLKLRESHALGTSEFLNDELVKMRGHLETVEQALKDYRRKYMGELPEQLPGNLMVLERLQQQLNAAQQQLRHQHAQMAAIDNQLKFMQQSVATTAAGESAEPSDLPSLKRRLQDYRDRYTEKHPEVVKLKAKIERLEEEVAEAAPAQGEAATVRSPLEADLLAQRGQALVNIQGIESEIGRIRSEIAFYQKRVENTPKREQELMSLKRDYENMQTTYGSFLARKLEADIAVNMEKKQKGEQFRIIDPARRPKRPISPDLRVIFLGCVMMGLAVGTGLVFLLEFLDNSVKKPDVFQERLSIPVLAVMPAIEFHRDRRWRYLNNGLSACAAVLSVVLAVCLSSVTVLDLPIIADRLRSLPLIG